MEKGVGGQEKSKNYTEFIEDPVKIAKEGIKDKIQVNLIINNRAGGNAHLIAQGFADSFHSEKKFSVLSLPETWGASSRRRWMAGEIPFF